MNLHGKILTLLFVVLSTLLAAERADARAIRVDSGAWDLSGFVSGDSDQSIGFNFDFFGVSSSIASISSDGSVSMSGGGEVVSLFPFFDANQSGGGNIAQYQFGVTNAAFSAAGVEAGFRVTWQIFDAGGALLNEFQLSLWNLAGDAFALEFNYNSILFGNDGSRIGYETSLGDSFDLPGALGLTFADYQGRGDDDFSNNCGNTPNALACNNYFDGAFGPGTGIMPDIANGFFRRTDANDDGAVGTVQGRYLFVSDAVDPPVAVSEPGTFALLGIGLLGMGLASRRKP